MFRLFIRWVQLTFLLSIAFLVAIRLFIGPATQGDWCHFAIAGLLGAVAALAVLPRMARSPSMTRTILPPRAASGAYRFGGRDDDDDDFPKINPSTGMPMMGLLDAGGNPFGSNSDDDSSSDNSSNFGDDD